MPDHPDVTISTDSTDTATVDVVDNTPAGEVPAASLPPAVEAAEATDTIAPDLTTDLSGVQNY